MKVRSKIVIVLLTVISALAIFIVQDYFPSPKSTFENLITKPIPHSVASLEEGHFVAMDSTFGVVHFQISEPDLATLLNTQHFAPIDENKEFNGWGQKLQTQSKISKEEYFSYWKRRIYASAKLSISLTTNWQVSILSEGRGRKYIIFDPNSSEAVFVAEAH